MLAVIQKHQRNWPVLVAGQQVAAAAGVVRQMPQTLAGLVELAVALLTQMGRMNSEQELLVDRQMH